MPESRFAPARFHASRCAGRRGSTPPSPSSSSCRSSRKPERRRRGDAARARRLQLGSSFHSAFPGIVVPPPRPCGARERAEARAAVVSSASRTPIARRAYRHGGEGCSGEFADYVERSKLFAEMARSRSRKRCSRAHRRGRARRVPRRNAPALHGRRRSSTSSALPRSGSGRSPTMREFARDPDARVHPQTVIEHFGTWNAAKRAAGLFPRRFLTRDELLEQLRSARRTSSGATPTARDLAARRAIRALGIALRAHVRIARQRAARGGVRGPAGRGAARTCDRAGRNASPSTLGRLPKMADWAEARRAGSLRCSRSGRCTGCWTSRAVPGPRSSTSFASDYARTGSTSSPDGTLGGLTEASAANRSRHETASRGARTGGRTPASR